MEIYNSEVLFSNMIPEPKWLYKVKKIMSRK